MRDKPSAQGSVPWTGAIKREGRNRGGEGSAEPVARRTVTFTCPTGHQLALVFADDVEPPQEWTCRQCGQPAHTGGAREAAQLPVEDVRASGRTHMDMVRERRSTQELEVILQERLEILRSSSRAVI